MSDLPQTPKALSVSLADQTHRLRLTALSFFEKDDQRPLPLVELFNRLGCAQVGQDISELSDLYAQVVSYTYFASQWTKTIDTVQPEHPHCQSNSFFSTLSSPFMEVLLQVCSSDLNEESNRVKEEIYSLLKSVDLLLIFQEQITPVTHFYQLFLEAYLPSVRKEKGSFYTPAPIVRQMTSWVHKTLIEDFHLPLGMADVSTWHELTLTHSMTVPSHVDPTTPFVLIVDPAMGTGTFLLHCLELIFETMTTEWLREGINQEDLPQQWSDYVDGLGRYHAKGLLKRLVGFEILNTPYVIAHLQLALFLYQTGYEFKSNSHFHLYSLNTLDTHFSRQERVSDNASTPIQQSLNTLGVPTVILGNPPYSISSANLGAHHRLLVQRYKSVLGLPIKERGALQLEKNLQDDYIKFFAWAEQELSDAGTGILSFISNHTFLDALSFRGMRASLFERFDSLYFIDLSGHYEKQRGQKDENVFDIRQGVSISHLVRLPIQVASQQVYLGELTGSRVEKFKQLETNSYHFTQINPQAPDFLFSIIDQTLVAEFERYISLDELFERYSTGIITARDSFSIAHSPEVLLKRAKQFIDPDLTDEEALIACQLNPKKGWRVPQARALLAGEQNLLSCIHPIRYRPLDGRCILYHPSVVWTMAKPTMQHMLSRNNLAIACSKQLRAASDTWQHVWLCHGLGESSLVSNRSKEVTFFFPLWLHKDRLDQQSTQSHCSNLKWERLLPTAQGAEAVFYYIISVLFSTSYRRRYQSLLSRRFPRIPPIKDINLFITLSNLGRRISQTINGPHHRTMRTLSIIGESHLIAAGFPKRKHEQLFINSTAQLTGVTDPVWQYQVGAYQPIKKWLQLHRGEVLSDQLLEQLSEHISLIEELIMLAQEIDETIELAGSWETIGS